MCGIVGYVSEAATPTAREVIMNGLARLEYRGYDSAGIALLEPQHPPFVVKAVGKLRNLANQLEGMTLPAASCAIGHTRWATHGEPAEENAHPHISTDGKLALVHNGIIENEDVFRSRLRQAGVNFRSQTDTEVIALWLGQLMEEMGEDAQQEANAGKSAPTNPTPTNSINLTNPTNPDSPAFNESALAGLDLSGVDAQEARMIRRLMAAMLEVTSQIEGTFTLLAVHQDAPHAVVAARRSSPLVIGVGEDANYLGSDALAFADYTTHALEIGQDQVVAVTPSQVLVVDHAGKPVEPKPFEVDFLRDRATKEGFPTFMEKEINEQPRGVRDTLVGRLDSRGALTLDELRIPETVLRRAERVTFVACGSAAYAAQVAKYAIEHWCRIPVEVELAHEFRYRDPVITEKNLVVAVSQSGETMDTIKAIRHAREQGAKVLAIVNTPGSTIARESDGVLLTHAGPEIAVASTKAFTAQIAATYVLGLYLAQIRGNKYLDEVQDYLKKLSEVPGKMETVLERGEDVRRVARQMADAKSVIFLGRHVGFPVAMEGALKLKEIAYIHAEGFAAGELKHGPIALIEEGQPVVVVVPTPRRPEMHQKVVSAIEQVRARGARTIVVAEDGDESVSSFADVVFRVPPAPTLYLPLEQVIPLQIFACEIATARGLDVDQPRNLAKSVTVE